MPGAKSVFHSQWNARLYGIRAQSNKYPTDSFQMTPCKMRQEWLLYNYVALTITRGMIPIISSVVDFSYFSIINKFLRVKVDHCAKWKFKWTAGWKYTKGFIKKLVFQVKETHAQFSFKKIFSLTKVDFSKEWPPPVVKKKFFSLVMRIVMLLIFEDTRPQATWFFTTPLTIVWEIKIKKHNWRRKIK